LDVSKNIRLVRLFCNNNQLTCLDLSNNTRLSLLDCSENQLSRNALNDMFETMPTINRKSLEPGGAIINDNPGTFCSDMSIALDKEWRMFIMKGVFLDLSLDECDCGRIRSRSKKLYN
jgi:hypothetical protein